LLNEVLRQPITFAPTIYMTHQFKIENFLMYGTSARRILEAAVARYSAIPLLLVAGALCPSLAIAQVSGSGSTLARGLMADWAIQFGPTVGGVTYAASGSSAGVKGAKDGTADFGVTDVPLHLIALQQSQLKQIPLAGTAVAVVLNLPELAGKNLKLTGDVLAEIYKGNIKEWNHSQIQAINRGIALPAIPIIPIWRNDGSGQSVVFTTYLSRQSVSWRRSPGVEGRLDLGTGRGVSGGAAMLAAVKATPGAIGYDAIGAVRTAGGLVVAALRNSAGNFTGPSEASILEALKMASWSEETSSADLDGLAGSDTYPMTTLTYAVLPRVAPKGRGNATSFLMESVAKGDVSAVKNGFVALPANAKALVAASAK
jgi:phosphate transport system substrate-binding protein